MGKTFLSWGCLHIHYVPISVLLLLPLLASQGAISWAAFWSLELSMLQLCQLYMVTMPMLIGPNLGGSHPFTNSVAVVGAIMAIANLFLVQTLVFFTLAQPAQQADRTAEIIALCLDLPTIVGLLIILWNNHLQTAWWKVSYGVGLPCAILFGQLALHGGLLWLEIPCITLCLLLFAWFPAYSFSQRIRNQSKWRGR